LQHRLDEELFLAGAAGDAELLLEQIGGGRSVVIIAPEFCVVCEDEQGEERFIV